MKKTRKILLAVLSVLTLASLSLGVTSCELIQPNPPITDSSSSQTADNEFRQVYAMYVTYAEAQGEPPLSYEMWLMSIRGEKGDQGEKGEDGKDGVDGENGKDGVDGQDGKDGVGIEKVEFDKDGNLVITFTDGTTQTVEMPKEETHVHTFGEWTAFTDEDTPCENNLFFRICSECKSIEWEQRTSSGHDWQTEYSYDDSFHWIACNNCDKVKDKAGHTLDNLGKCTVCKQLVATPGVNYRVSEDGTYAEVISYTGTAIDVVISDTYKSLPVTNIGERAFQSPQITSVIIPESVTSIDTYAFYECSRLASVTIPDSITSIRERAFYNCSSLTFQEYDNCQYLSNEKNPYFALIQAKNKNYSSYSIHKNTKVIADNALEGCSRMESITIPNSVTSIGDYAFFYCSSLTSVIIPDSVTSIGKSAFRFCSRLTSVTIGDSVTSIGNYAFSSCSSLTNVTIPDSVTSIGDWAFEYCSSLTGVYITSIEAWCNISFDNYSANPLYYANKLYLNNELVTELTISDSVTEIKSYAFLNCDNLTSVTIGDSVTSIGKSAFKNCSRLTEINFNATACTDLSSNNNVFYNAGQSGTKITVTIGANVTKIPAYLFNPRSYSSDAPKITKVVFEDGSVCESIGRDAFSYCSSLTSVTIPDNITSIKSNAFYGCDKAFHEYGNCQYVGNEKNPYLVLIQTKNQNYSSYTIHENTKVIANYAFSECSSLTSVTIGNSVTSIGDRVFSGCSNLTSVVIGDGITSIGNTFSYCKSLTSITVSENNTAYKSIDGNLYTKDGTELIKYAIGKTDSSFIIPDGITSIGDSAFYSCSSLTSITIPDSVTSIGDWAFGYCSGLTNVTIPNSVTSIGSSAFYGCNSLTSITIGDSVTSIGYYAFLNCDNLTSVTIGNSVTSLGNTFSYCKNLTSITVSANNTAYKSIDGNLYTKDGTELIQYAIGKTNSSFVIPDSVTSIGSSAFYSCSSLTSITIPDSVTSIGDWAFGYCSGLTNVTIPNSVTSIEIFAFYHCHSLTSLTIGDSVTSIGALAFEYCESLTTVYYGGTAENWNKINIGDGYGYNHYYLTAATRYYYSESEPTTSGKYWHYDTDGKTILIW